MNYTVIIPAHNEERFVGEAVESALLQTARPTEVIVIDDGSTDETANVAALAGARVIRNEVSRGPSASRNIAVAQVTTEFVAFLDADDLWTPKHACLVMKAMAVKRAVFGGSKVMRFGDVNGTVPTALSRHEPLHIRDALIVENPIVLSTVIVERAAFLAAGGYDEAMRFSEDYDFWFRLSRAEDFAYVDVATVRRRVHANQVSAIRQSDMVRAAWGVRRRRIGERLSDAAPASREQILLLVERAARLDIAWAVWAGMPAMLQLLREELALVDSSFATGARFSALAGGGGRLGRRLLQDVRTRLRGIIGSVRAASVSL